MLRGVAPSCFLLLLFFFCFHNWFFGTRLRTRPQASSSPGHGYQTTSLRKEGLPMPPIKSHQRSFEKYVYVIAMCTKRDDKPHSEKPQQLEQSIVLIKSAVAMTSQVLRFIVLSDSIEQFKDLETYLTNALPIKERRKLVLEYRGMEYPPEGLALRDLFKACATARLFAPMLLQFDSVVYLDTDTIFMRPPEHLWEVFQRFKPNQLIGLTETRGFYNKYDFKFPWYGDTGLNSGVLLLNLTRIDHFPGGWIKSFYKAFDRYKSLLQTGDQDLLNIVFSDKPELVRDIGCDWNYCGGFCELERLRCRKAEQNGVSLIHGNAQTLYQGHIKVVFNAWKNYQFGTSLEKLWEKIEIELEEIEPSLCPNVYHMSQILTKWTRKNHFHWNKNFLSPK